MPGEQEIDAKIVDRIQRQFLSSDSLPEHARVVDRKREQRVVGDQKAQVARRGVGEMRADEVDLLAADPALAEGQRTGGIEAQDRHSWKLVPRTQRIVDIALVAPER